MKTYADTVTAAHELQTHFALRATSEERNAFATLRTIRQGNDLYRETLRHSSNVPAYLIARNGGPWQYSTASECYASLVQI